LSLRAADPAAFAGSYEPLDLDPDTVGFVREGRIEVIVPLRPANGQPTISRRGRAAA
jgi:hypothetical protein